MTNADYTDIKDITIKNKSFVTNALVIAGEANKGIQTGVCSLVYLKLLFKYKLYTRVTFSHLIGSSVGSVIILIFLNACYLYEEINTEIAEKYIVEAIETLNFANIRKILLDNGNGTCLGDDLNLNKIFIRLLITGGLFERQQLRLFLDGEYFPNFKDYFKDSLFYTWLDNRLKTVYIVSHNSVMTQQLCYTGDNCCIANQYIKFPRLNYANIIDIIIASSAIPFIYSPAILENGLKASDGSVSAISPIELMSSISNRYYHSNENVHARIYDEFGITNRKDFCITLIIINLQRRFTDVLELNNESAFDIIRAVKSVFNLVPNAIYNSRASLGAMGSLISKKFIDKLSTLDYSKITLKGKDRYYKRCENELKGKVFKTTERIPTLIITEQEKSYYEPYKKYLENNIDDYIIKYKENASLTSNFIVSTYLNSYSGSDTSTTCIIYDTIVRCPFDNKLVESFIELVIKNDSGFCEQMRNVGVIQGNQLFDFYIKQMTYNKAGIKTLLEK